MRVGQRCNLGDTLQEHNSLGRGEFIQILRRELGGLGLVAGIVPFLAQAVAGLGEGIVEPVVDRGLSTTKRKRKLALWLLSFGPAKYLAGGPNEYTTLPSYHASSSQPSLPVNLVQKVNLLLAKGLLHERVEESLPVICVDGATGEFLNVGLHVGLKDLSTAQVLLKVVQQVESLL